ncbi:DAPG hydrolase family protein [Leptospira haakeii]|uniref:DAPG hydrolase PhiG domain-containing protein n=1 Tax=Leptospira haakeii TaxID=2023198 RepID=A0ABX4PKP3_9LEPT|nr:hypothetical protein [Leptospira haakeii]PKA15608.1 hypothetical protein CH363_13485 [Leptospira haakeii]PKA18974.1 hypothetical protein CH377_15380 [Leptospira haakeii]
MKPVTYFPIPTQYQFAKNQKLIADKEYRHYFNGDLRLPDDIIPLLGSPMNSFDALQPDPKSLNSLLDPGYHSVENGYCELSDGTAYVTSLVDFPGCTGDMYKWWFWWHSVESARYTLWYPHNHVSARPVNREVLTRPGLLPEQRYIGNTHNIDEYIGPDLVKIAIRFLDPSELGFDTSRFEAAGIVGHACARVSFRFPRLEAVTMIHLARKTERGIEQRSRYWIGHNTKLRIFGASIPLDNIAAKLGIKRRMGGERIAYEQFLHDQIEFNHLSTILPGIYSEFGSREI